MTFGTTSILTPFREYLRPGFDPWVRKIPWRRKWQLTPVLLLGKIPWTEEPGRLQPMGSQRVRHYWATSLSLNFTYPWVHAFILSRKCFFFKVFFIFFWCGPFLKSLLNWLQHCFSFFLFWFFFGHQAFEILAPPPGIKPTPHALEDKALTIGPRGKPLKKIS